MLSKVSGKFSSDKSAMDPWHWQSTANQFRILVPTFSANILMGFRWPFFRYWNRSNIRLWLFGENLNKSPRPLKVSPPRIPAFAARRDLSNDSSREKVWQLIKVMTAKRVKSGSSYAPRQLAHNFFIFFAFIRVEANKIWSDVAMGLRGGAVGLTPPPWRAFNYVLHQLSAFHVPCLRIIIVLQDFILLSPLTRWVAQSNHQFAVCRNCMTSKDSLTRLCRLLTDRAELKSALSDSIRPRF